MSRGKSTLYSLLAGALAVFPGFFIIKTLVGVVDSRSQPLFWVLSIVLSFILARSQPVGDKAVLRSGLNFLWYLVCFWAAFFVIFIALFAGGIFGGGAM